MQRGHPLILPKTIRLESASYCQLKCPSCPTASGAIRPGVGTGHLRLDNFKKLLDDNPRITRIELSNYGEMFLNKELTKIMQYADSRGVLLTADNGVNLNTTTNEQLEALVKFKFHSLTCSIDGGSAETYQRYRIGGDFNRVVEHVKTINAFKKRYRSRYPLLTWQFIVFGFNQHEIPLAKKLAADLNMKFREKLTWDDDFSSLRDQDKLRNALGFGVSSRREYEDKYGIDYTRGNCHQLWNAPQINWDGKVLGCCRNFWGDFGGNVFKEGLTRSLNNEKISYARQMLLGKKEARPDIPCTTCDLYESMKARNKWITMEEVGLSAQALRLAYRYFGGRPLYVRLLGYLVIAKETLDIYRMRLARALRPWKQE